MHTTTGEMTNKAMEQFGSYLRLLGRLRYGLRAVVSSVHQTTQAPKSFMASPIDIKCALFC